MFVKRPVKNVLSWVLNSDRVRRFHRLAGKTSPFQKDGAVKLKACWPMISKCSLRFAKASHLRNGRCMIYELLIYRMLVLVCIIGKDGGSNLQVEPSGGRFQTFRLCVALNSVSLCKSLSVSVWLIVLFICIVCIYICTLFHACKCVLITVNTVAFCCCFVRK